MSLEQFKVLECAYCGQLVYKRVSYKVSRCPMCKKKLQGAPIKLCQTAKEATAFIKQQKLKNAAAEGDLFESFG